MPKTAIAAERHMGVMQDEQRLCLLDAASNQGGPSLILHRKISLATRLAQSGTPEAHGHRGLPAHHGAEGWRERARTCAAAAGRPLGI